MKGSATAYGFSEARRGNAAAPAAAAARYRISRAAAVLLVALACVLAMFAAPASAVATEVDPQTQAALEQLQQAFSDAYAASQGADGIVADGASSLKAEPAGVESIADDETPPAAYDASATGGAAEEEILDDENPLAANPYAKPVFDFVWVLLALIIGVAGFFLVSTRRLNKNIRQMRSFVD